MGNRHRAAISNLLSKFRNNATTAPKYIAEPNRNKLCAAFALQALANHLSQAFTRAHHIRWINSLIGRDQYKCANVCFFTRFSNGISA